MTTTPNLLWCLPAMQEELARLEASIANKSDDAMVRPPFGDSVPTRVSVLRLRVARRKEEIADMINMASQGRYADGSKA